MENKLAQLKKKYITSFEKKITDIQQAWEKTDVSHLHHLLHKLSGSSGSYGFVELSGLCRQGMELTEELSPAPVVLTEIELVLKQINTLMKQEQSNKNLVK